MDPITHTLTGALFSQSVCKKNFIRQATLIGMLSGAAPDLDFFVHSKFNPLLNLEIHRSFTHSFLFIPIGGIIMMLFFLLLFKSWRPRWKEVVGLSTLAYATHSFLDACTSYGTQLFWPFSTDRISWDVLPIVAPVFTLILFLGVVCAYNMRSSNIARYGLIAAFLYVGVGIMQHEKAMSFQRELIASRQQTHTTQNRVMPRFGGLSRWDSLYIYKNRAYLDTIETPLLQRIYVEQDVSFSVPFFNPSLISIPDASLSSVETFIWFTQNYTTALSYNPLILADLRYVRKDAGNPKSFWGMEWHFGKKHPMVMLRSINLEKTDKD